MMHANDFQKQLAAVMDILVKAAVHKTTKLHETGVLELKLEMAQMKQENAQLKARLRYCDCMWKRNGRLEDGNIIIVSNHKSQRIEPELAGEYCREEQQFPDPLRRTKGGAEEMETTVLNPASAFKEETPEMQYVLIKQEDSDTEDCLPQSPPSQRERGVAVTDGPRPAPGSDRSGRWVHGAETRKLEPRGKQDGGLGAGAHRGAVQSQICSGTSISPSLCVTAPGLTEPWGMSWPPASPPHRAGYSSGSSLTRFAGVNQESPLQDTISETQQDVEDIAGVTSELEQEGVGHGQGWAKHKQEVTFHEQGGVTCEQEVSGHEQEGAGLVFSHHVLDGWSCGPRELLPGSSQQRHLQEIPAFRSGQRGPGLSSAAALEAHRSAPAGERPHPCSQCPKTFPTLRGLNRHRQIHSAEKLYRCSQCAKSFAQRFSLTVHARSHSEETPHRCFVCGKEFRHRRALNAHLQGHRGERRHHCPYCAKSFLDLGNFKRHKRIHTGEKPYGCTICGRRFTQSAHLKKHFLTHR
ncbi:hypothetical protein GJAV_G00156270 [Gymnothorax javanicus]|nr:hypothetical protein GJAV_G00156270 [Gymnothorax javanicus]